PEDRHPALDIREQVRRHAWSVEDARIELPGPALRLLHDRTLRDVPCQVRLDPGVLRYDPEPGYGLFGRGVVPQGPERLPPRRRIVLRDRPPGCRVDGDDPGDGI